MTFAARGLHGVDEGHLVDHVATLDLILTDLDLRVTFGMTFSLLVQGEGVLVQDGPGRLPGILEKLERGRFHI